MISRIAKSKASLGFVAAVCAGGTIGIAAHADQMTLRAPAGDFKATGEFVAFEDGEYVVNTELGIMRVPGDRVICEGADCFAALTEDADVTIEGSDTLALGLMPLLMTGFSQSLDAGLSRDQNASGTQDLYTLTENQGFGDPLPDYLVRSTTSVDGMEALIEGRSDIAMSSRPITAEELELMEEAGIEFTPANLGETVVAVDSLAIITHPENPVDSISLTQLAGIYAGELTNWSQLGGDDQPIVAISQGENSGTRTFFETTIFTQDSTGAPAQEIVEPDPEAVARRVLSDPSAVGYTSLAFLRGTKPLSVESACGIQSEASMFTVKAEEYPLERRLYLYAIPGLQGPGADLIRYALSPDADEVIAKAGFANFAVVRKDRDMSAAEIAARLRGITEDSEYLLAQQMLSEMNQWDRLSTTLRFPPGSSVLGAKELNDLRRLISYLSTLPENTEVAFVGFADTDGPFEDNLVLSEARALSVAQNIDALADDRVDNIEFSARGYGELNPVACNDDPFSKAVNRRVEVWIKTPA